MRILACLLFVVAAGTAQAACGPQDGIPAAERVVNTVKWTTASEQDNFGYNVYRGDAEDGPFAKLTEKPLLGHGTTDETHDYQYRDDSIDPCKAYWYYVEAISTNGAHERFTPVIRVKAKQAASH